MKQENPSPKSKKFDEIEDQIRTLLDELQLAIKWDRPSILLASYRTNLVLIDAQTSLTSKLLKVNNSVCSIKINNQNFDIAQILSHYPNRQSTVFFISALTQGGGTNGLNAYRALNMRRELLVDNHIRVIFWLNQEEAEILPLQALDFWAFRHRMLEFSSQPTYRRVKKLVETLDWPSWDFIPPSLDYSTAIENREIILHEILDWGKAPILRAKLCIMLAGLHWAKKDFKLSDNWLKKSWQIIDPLHEYSLKAQYWNAKGRIFQSTGNTDQAIQAYQESINLDPHSAEAWFNLATSYRAQNKLRDAESAANNSINLDSKYIRSWNLLGDLQYYFGNFENSASSYQRSLKLNPKNPEIWIKLGNTFNSIGQPLNARGAFIKAKQLNPKDATVWVYLGLVSNSLGLTKSSIRSLYKATRLLPDSPDPWKILGDIYKTHQRLPLARKTYKRAILLDPTNHSLLESLNSCYLKPQKLFYKN